jgi:biotin carboxyl carrier protein
LQIFVKEGDTVNVGDKLLIMEAMKMENDVLAEKSGTIKSVKISPNDAVLQNDLLIEII